MKNTLLAIVLMFVFPFSAEASRILFFGDSHSVATAGPFGIRMNQLLRDLPNAEVTTRARCGSTLGWWYSGKATTCGYFDQDPTGPALPVPFQGSWPTKANTPLISSLIEKTEPDLIVVEMGGNYLAASDPEALVKKEVSPFIEDLKRIKMSRPHLECVWIGLPSRRLPVDPQEAAKFQAKIDLVVTTIHETVDGTCEFIDSTKLTEFPIRGGKDGVHYSFPEGIPVAHAWAEAAFITVKAHYEKTYE